MGRVLSPYEIAWRKSVGHPVDDDDELERLTAPSGESAAAPVVVEQSAPAEQQAPAAPVVAPPAPAPPAKPTGKPAGK